MSPIKTKTITRPYSRAGLSALLGLGAASSAQAIITMSPTVGAGINPPSSDGNTNWDVDGDGTNDFQLRNNSSSYASFDDQNGGRVFGKTSYLNHPFQNIALSKTISSGVSGYGFAPTPQEATVTSSGSMALNALAGGWGTFGTPLPITGFIGFKFTNVSGTHFGWAEVTIDGTTGGALVGQGYTINEAWYNTVPGQGLLAGTQTPVIPEPAATAAGLAGLALGAASLRRWRKAKAKVA